MPAASSSTGSASFHLFAPSRLCLPHLKLFLNSFKYGLLLWFTGELLSLPWYLCLTDVFYPLGTIAWPILDEFSENFQTASDPPPPYFRKTMLRFFREARKFATKFIRIGVTPPLFPKIHRFYPPKITEKTATKFFGSEMTPPPLRKFSENSSKMVHRSVPNRKCYFAHFQCHHNHSYFPVMRYLSLLDQWEMDSLPEMRIAPAEIQVDC